MKITLISINFLLLAGSLLHATGTRPAPAQAPAPQYDVVSVSNGKASWYGGRWIGRKTANGEIYRAGDMTAAHKTLPFGTLVRVTDERTQESTVVRINNRGPFIKGRSIDLSVAAAEELGLRRRGVARVKLEVLEEREMVAAEPVPAHKRGWFSSLFERKKALN